MRVFALWFFAIFNSCLFILEGNDFYMLVANAFALAAIVLTEDK